MLSSKIKKGFTLVELMIVIAIIGILAAALFPALTSYLSRGRDTKKIAEIKQLNTALIVYKIDTGGHYVPGTGYMGGGQGWINFANGSLYPKSLFVGLQELGYIPANIKQIIPSNWNTPTITHNSAPCQSSPLVGQDMYMYYFDANTGQYSLSAYLESPKQTDIDNIVLSYNGIGGGGTCTLYGMNYAVGQN